MRSIGTWAQGLALLAALGLAVGCSSSSGTGTGGNKRPGTGQRGGGKHDHPEEGPHHGALVEWGDEEYHLEFTVDHKKQEARVYVLGPDAKKPAPIKADKLLLTIKEPSMQVELKPEPQKDDPAGTASVFVGKNEKLGKEQEFAGTISGEVNGKPYSGDFKEEPHDHKHEKK